MLYTKYLLLSLCAVASSFATTVGSAHLDLNTTTTAACSPAQLKIMPVRKALVVGGTSGIGHGISLYLAKTGVDVTIAGRSESAGTKIVGEMNDVSRAAGHIEPNHSFVKVDAFDLTDVKNLAHAHSGTQLDYLVMTQGMATIQGLTLTNDNIDQKLCLHYYSRMLLANILAPTLSKSDDGKVLSVLSAGVHSAYTGLESDPLLEKNYSIKNAADAAGYYNDLGCDLLAQKYPKLAVSHACPGFVNTNWGTEMPWALRMCVRGLQVFGTSLEQCGENLGGGLLKLSPGFTLMDPDGNPSANKLSEHNDASLEILKKHTEDVLKKWM